MFAVLRTSILAALMPAAVFGATQRRAIDGPFELWAYGTGIGGFPLFYSRGLAFAGNVSQFSANDSNAAIASFVTGPDNSWIASPVNATTNWNRATLFIPSTAMESSLVGFLPENSGGNASIETTGFSFYGTTAMKIEADGSLASGFTGLPVSDDVIQIFWNDTSSGQVPIALRGVAPSSPPPFIPATQLTPATGSNPGDASSAS
ncbi:unnamed protein product [Periconia digitata]|uniref:Uncharacterized protein n=1 Tax=Periconia digitata TaxID=1303443 RepID=A0A9W4XRT6_9PLEO|nr:unnamed protein product [Periconia digitata]